LEGNGEIEAGRGGRGGREGGREGGVLSFTWMEVNMYRSLFKRRGSGGKTGTGIKPAMRQARKAMVKSREGRKTRRTRSPFWNRRGRGGFLTREDVEEEEDEAEGGGRSPLAMVRARMYVSA